MTAMEAITLVVTALVVPYVVALVRNKAITGNKARWLAVGVSALAGVVAAFVGGIPMTPSAWITCIMAAIGAMQTAYTLFKSVGITSKWLDALMALRKDEDNPAIVAKNQSTKDISDEIKPGGTDA